jgi:hypothetical protein
LLVSAHRASRLALNSANPCHSGWIFEVGYLDAALGGSGPFRGCESMSSINQLSALNGLEDLCKLPVNSCMFG